jgi:two-component sensor histidine kinase
MYLLPIGWILVGGLNIAIIAALSVVADELVAANRRQRFLFLEVQHRVANTLQAVVGTLDVAIRRMASSPVDAIQLMENAAQRFAASADVHRRICSTRCKPHLARWITFGLTVFRKIS